MPTEGRGTLVIVPAFNEEASVAAVVRGVREAGYDVVVVDDGSQDETAREAKSAGAVVLRLGLNLGVGGALRCGFRYAVDQGYFAVVQCDGDGQHDPAQIVVLEKTATAEDADLVIGSRFSRSGGFEATALRRTAMRVLSRVATKAAHRPITDTTSGFRFVREPLLSEFAQRYPAQYLGDTFEVLVAAARAGYRISEVPVTMSARTAGVASAGSLSSLQYLLRALLVLLLRTASRFSPRGTTEESAP